MWWNLFFLCLIIAALSVLIVDRLVVRHRSTRRLEKAREEYLRNSNALIMGLLETYCIRCKKPTNLQDAEDLYHVLRNR